ncbi:leucyl aminopeptidase [Candidatus Uhrbacteria bacterium]|nr:leucyl aminopeptidase [Candidatus Uhrbacteria bacterium]
MRYTLTSDAPFRAAVDAIVLVVGEDAVATFPPELKQIDATLGGLLTAACAIKEFKGEEHSSLLLLTNGKIPAPRLLLVGAGRSKDRNFLEWQHIIGAAARSLQRAKVTRWALVLPSFARRFRTEELGRMTAKGVLVSTYHYTQYKSDPNAKQPMPEEIIVGPLTAAQQRAFRAGAAEGTTIAEAMNWMRDFGNMPSSDATPTFLASQAQVLAKTDKRFRLKIIDRPEMEKLGMGALLGVARGAATPPKCIVLEWRGGQQRGQTLLRKGSDPVSAPWYAFVGKGITFDSGGISLKPGDKMDEMKFDMSGGAAVLGGMKAISGLGLKANIVGIIPATDNLPSGSAYKPGDILRTCRGKTLEVLNTDAEGRLVLADGIGYALRYEPKAIVDLATLTGAIGVALGNHYTGLFSNDGRLRRRVEDAAEQSGDRVWPMPTGDAYIREVKSDIADLQNLGKAGRLGAACTAAAFLEVCAEGAPWVHLDIAYTATSDGTAWLAKGATGVGVHVLVELAKGWAKK